MTLYLPPTVALDFSVIIHKPKNQEGVGVMKDIELKLDEMKSSHTLGGPGECVTSVEKIKKLPTLTWICQKNVLFIIEDKTRCKGKT